MIRFHVILHQPEIPQNTGNIGRTCVALDCKLWLVRPFGFRLDDKSLRRSGLDYWKRLQWEVVDRWEDWRVRLPARRTWYFSKYAERTYTQPQYQAGDFFVFGCETQGLPGNLLREQAGQSLRIPMSDKVRSLNLSNAVAVVLYEAYRQTERQHPL